MQAWMPYHRKDIDNYACKNTKDAVTATKLIPGLRDLSYNERLKECGLTTLQTRRLGMDQIEVFKILNGHENIDPTTFSQLRQVNELEDMTSR